MRLFNIKYKKISIALLTLLCVTIMIITLSMRENIIFSFSSGAQMSITSFKGILQSLMVLLCIIMILINYKAGTISALACIMISVVSCSFQVFAIKNYQALPGLLNAIVGIICLLIISNQYGKAEKDAITDYITGLINRRGLENIISQEISKGHSGQLIFIHITNMKNVNENLGHIYGDSILKSIATRLTERVSEFSKNGVICRAGGVDFALIIPSDCESEMVLNDLISIIKEPISITRERNKFNCYISACAGSARFPEDANTAQQLIMNADIATNYARHTAGIKYAIYTEEMGNKISREIKIEHVLKEALKNDDFYLMYQPQFHTDGKTLRGYEALLRLTTKDGTVYSPGEFIPIAEKTDIIYDIDRYVLKKSMLDFKDQLSNAKDDILLSVNVSSRNASTSSFSKMIKETLDETGFPAEKLEIELTEHSFSDSAESTIESIKKIQALGVKIAIDDFGTGYTALSVLLNLPVNALKIDKSLIDEINTDEKHKNFVTAIIKMGHILNCELISEGVEYDDQLSILKELKCECIQGYIWSKPLLYENAIKLIQ